MKLNHINKLAVGCLFLQSVQGFAAEKNSKPNIILIMTDQQSYNTISALQQTYTSTPNIDRLVKNGISFTNTMCANPVSVPSRFSIFTGKYGGDYQVRDNRCVNAEEAEILDVLKNSGMGNIFKRNGYETVYGGKVHLPFATGKSKFGAPVNYGFSNYLTSDDRYELQDVASDFIAKRTSTTPLLMVVSFINPHDICLESSTNLSSDVKVDPKKPEIAATINKIRAKGATYDTNTFYSKIAPALPDNFDLTKGFPSNFAAGMFDNFPADYWRKYRWTYAQLVALADSHIGKVLDAIDQWSQKENTIVIFTSDHGEMQGAHHTTTKNLPYDECQHVPFIIAGKGIVKNQRDNSLICNGTDIIPTMCELAGIETPKDLNGISLAQRAQGKKEAVQRKFLYLEGDGFSNVIEDGSYKFTIFAVNSGNNKMLIDLKKDKGELFNVYDVNAGYAKKTAELNGMVSEYMKNQPELTTVLHAVKQGGKIKQKQGNKQK